MAISNNGVGIRPGVCTSTTRPTAPYEGQHIYETDTDIEYVWNGTAWVEIASMLTKAPRGIVSYTQVTSTDSSITAEETQITGTAFTAVANRYYRVTYFEPRLYGSAAANMTMRIKNGATTLQRTDVACLTTQEQTGTDIYVGTFTAGSVTLTATLGYGSGTGIAARAASEIAFLLVEDIGAA